LLASRSSRAFWVAARSPAMLPRIGVIGREADAILAGGVTIASQLDLLAGLVPTKEGVTKIRAGVLAYGAALDKIL
ncbi:MAG TPA: hypothetical protein VGR20_12180, partial [Acidimicrobiia bacterium]|nr:hypothetical protein [Acidimicrobiia bacterium]